MKHESGMRGAFSFERCSKKRRRRVGGTDQWRWRRMLLLREPNLSPPLTLSIILQCESVSLSQAPINAGDSIHLSPPTIFENSKSKIPTQYISKNNKPNCSKRKNTFGSRKCFYFILKIKHYT